MAIKTKPRKKAKKAQTTTAWHGVADCGHDVVGIDNLRVVVVEESDGCFAQGLEIDYAAEGATLKEAQANFAEGLEATIHENLKAYGSISRLLKVAPTEVWNDYYFSKIGKTKKYSQVSHHALSEKSQEVLGFSNIAFLKQDKRAEMATA